jgi:acyl carrier protein phosphodiesterase
VNYLAHAYLSFNHPEILVGNMISDFVKGKQKFDYAPGIQTGIMLHRFIDTFTDAHPATHAAKQLFKPVYGLYAGAFIDVVYDHFLAIDEAQFVPEGLEAFADGVYKSLEAYTGVFPERFARMFPFMQEQNWLKGYADRQGIYHSFNGLVRRAKYMEDFTTAFAIFEREYKHLEQYYHDFFPSVKELAANHLNND